MDEDAGFTVSNTTYVDPTNPVPLTLNIEDGRAVVAVEFDMNGSSNQYTNFTFVDVATGSILNAFTPPTTATTSFYARAGNGNMVVPFLAGLTAWDINGKFVARKTTVHGILTAVARKSSVVVIYQNWIEAFSL